MDCESGAQWKRIICFLLSSRKRIFEGQELLIGLPFKGISYSLSLSLLLWNIHNGIRGNSPAAEGAAGRLWGGKVSKPIGDNSLDYVGIEGPRRSRGDGEEDHPTRNIHKDGCPLQGPSSWLFFPPHLSLFFFTTFRSSTSFPNPSHPSVSGTVAHPQHVPVHSSSLGWPNAKKKGRKNKKTGTTRRRKNTSQVCLFIHIDMPSRVAVGRWGIYWNCNIGRRSKEGGIPYWAIVLWRYESLKGYVRHECP